jgi:hypothetical protein
VNRGALDRRHITWTPRLKDQDVEANGEKKKSPKKTKPVVQVPPATAPPSDTPTPAALTPVQPPVARVEESPADSYDRMIREHRAKYVELRHHPDLLYFDAWFSAKRSTKFSASLIEDEKIWHRRPHPRQRPDRPPQDIPIAGPKTAAEKEAAEREAAEKEAAEREAAEKEAAEKEAAAQELAEEIAATSEDEPAGDLPPVEVEPVIDQPHPVPATTADVPEVPQDRLEEHEKVIAGDSVQDDDLDALFGEGLDNDEHDSLFGDAEEQNG